MSRTRVVCLGVSLLAWSFFVWQPGPVSSQKRGALGSLVWNPNTAQAFLHKRASQWREWKSRLKSGHRRRCISCHTTLPYMMVQGALFSPLRKQHTQEKLIWKDIGLRLKHWGKASYKPWYGRKRSMGTEAALNLIILGWQDRNARHPLTQQAIKLLWKEAQSVSLPGGKKGIYWPWLSFETFEPFESKDAQLWGASLVAVTLHKMAAVHRQKGKQHLAKLRRYLRHHFTQATTSLHSKVAILWASSALPGLLSKTQRTTLQTLILKRQRKDGSWSLASMGPWNATTKPRSFKGDGYATAYVLYVLGQVGYSARHPKIEKGLRWLCQHQDAKGFWKTPSLHGRTRRFMRDTATALAVLALRHYRIKHKR